MLLLLEFLFVFVFCLFLVGWLVGFLAQLWEFRSLISIASVPGRNAADSCLFKHPFLITASRVHFLLFFNISHFLAEISSRKHQKFYNEDKNQNFTHQISLVDYFFLFSLTLF